MYFSRVKIDPDDALIGQHPLIVNNVHASKMRVKVSLLTEQITLDRNRTVFVKLASGQSQRILAEEIETGQQLLAF